MIKIKFIIIIFIQDERGCMHISYFLEYCLEYFKNFLQPCPQLLYLFMVIKSCHDQLKIALLTAAMVIPSLTLLILS